jgi:hypothetical protein
MDRQGTSEIYNVLTSLMQIDVDAQRAYAQAIAAIHVVPIRRLLEAFRTDHERHADDIKAEFRNLGMAAPLRTPDLEGFLLAGYTAIRRTAGTEAALKAMRSNERLTIRRYEDALKADIPEPVHQLIERNLLDERRHVRFIEDALAKRSWEQAPADTTRS